ncbi:hypothetical protein [Bacillus chungangensis]|uniref:Uncharacterized protein n=1 Tax=Bacillus chungangensis TaxID=587633 RepID=A0ABT9WYK1_9BACI|nr:hypothetical protein [Bacillus chungangensis]MDQ0178188.1 hypothetical protein [Bacillus chungangensis]
MKKFIVITLLFSGFFLLNGEKALAGCYERGETVIDNDHNGIDSSDNRYIGTWQYQTGGRSFRGDHRFAPIQDKNISYTWYFGRCDQYNATLYVYLWDSSFTNPKAEYVMTNDQFKNSSFFINQQNAPGGWSKVGTSAYKGVNSVSVQQPFPSEIRTGGTGADGAKLIYHK